MAMKCPNCGGPIALNSDVCARCRLKNPADAYGTGCLITLVLALFHVPGGVFRWLFVTNEHGIIATIFDSVLTSGGWAISFLFWCFVGLVWKIARNASKPPAKKRKRSSYSPSPSQPVPQYLIEEPETPDAPIVAEALSNPDDLDVRKAKYEKLAPALYAALVKSLRCKAISPDVKKELQRVARKIGMMMTGYKPTQAGGEKYVQRLTTEPILPIMTLVHQDESIPEEVKQTRWLSPTDVLFKIMLPAFDADNDTWYDPNATAPQGRVPPENAPDFNEMEYVEERWQKMMEKFSSS